MAGRHYKYRAVLMVPTVVEFETPLDDHYVTKQVRQIASGMGKAKGEARDKTYVPIVVEVARQDVPNPQPPPTNLDIRDE